MRMALCSLPGHGAFLFVIRGLTFVIKMLTFANVKKKEKPTDGKPKLTQKQKAFCVYYCKNGWNGTQAAISAGYSKETAQQIASENLLKPVIRAEIERLKGNLEDLLNISKARVISEHMKLAFASMADLHETWMTRKEFESLPEDVRSCIEEVSTTKKTYTTPDGSPIEEEHVKVRLYDKQKALDSISKLMGYDAPVKAELSGSFDIHQITGMEVR